MRNAKTIAALILVSTLCLSACGGEQGPATAGPALLDSCTDQEIGFKDPATGNLVFFDGTVVPADKIAHRNLDEIPEMCPVEPAGSGVEPVGYQGFMGAVGSNGRCWYMSEVYPGGYVSCSGCCLPVSGGHYCFSDCDDYQHS